MSFPETKPAPGELVAVQTLLNSVDVDEGTEALAEPETAAAWLTAHGLLEPGARIDPAGLERLVAVRDGLRALAVVNGGGEPEPAALEGLHGAAGEVRLRPVLSGAGLRLEPAVAGVEGLITRVVSAVHAAEADGTWCRMKTCRDDTCRWVFWDASKNVCGAWCEMGSCGNRAKARRYRSRHRAPASGAAPPSRERER